MREARRNDRGGRDEGRRRTATRGRGRWQRIALHAFLIGAALLWLFPIAWTLYIALRPFSDTIVNDYFSTPNALTLDNFFDGLEGRRPGPVLRQHADHRRPGGAHHAVHLVDARLRLLALLRSGPTSLLLMMFTAGNLLPPQVIIVPLYRMYLLLPLPKSLSDVGTLYDSYFGIILIHIVFQTGFCTFVLSNYMKTHLAGADARRRSSTAPRSG